MTEKYEDIINLPHHVSKIRPQMSMLERAAQFSPFAALNGYGEGFGSERQPCSSVGNPVLLMK